MEQKQRVRHREEAVELIECYLQANDIPPHGKLPAEWEMCEMWGLNRTTLRAAIRRLTEMGKLYSLKGSGTYVAPPKLERNLQDAKSTTESVRGEESIGITYAAESEARQLCIEEGGSLFFLTGIVRDYNNIPVEFFKSVARPDMVRFSSILRKYRTEPERRQPL